MMSFFQAFWTIASDVLSFAASNAPSIFAFLALSIAITGQYIAIIKLGNKMTVGFTEMHRRIDGVCYEMKEGFLKVDHRLDNHDKDIKEVKKRIKRLEKSNKKHHLNHLMLIRKLDQTHQR
jgi:hypothetical protein